MLTRSIAALSAAVVLALGGCTSAQIQDPTTVFSGVVATYTGAVAAEVTYESVGKPDPALVAKLETYRIAAHNVLQPIEDDIAKGNAPTSVTVLAAQAAVTALTNYESTNGINAGN